MGAGSGRAHASEGGEFSAGAGAIVHQREEYAGTSRFADSGGNLGNRDVVAAGGNASVCRSCNHSSMINEVCLHGKD